MNNKNIFSSKFLIRLVLFSLLLGTLPVVTLGTLSYIRAKQSVQEQVNEGNMQLLQQTKMNVEQVLQLFENLMTQFITTPQVNEALQMPLSAKDFIIINDLKVRINKLQPYELGVQNVYLANLSYDWVLSNEGFGPLNEDKAKDMITAYTKVQRASFWTSVPLDATADSAKEGFSGDKEMGSVRLVKKLPLNWQNFSGLIIGEIPAQKLEKLVFNDSADREMVIVDNDYHPLTRPIGRVLKHKNDLPLALEQIKNASNPLQGYISYRSEDFTIGVMYQKSDYNGWTYLSFSSIDNITKESRSIGWYTLYVSLAIFVLILLIALIGSRRMYSPIRNVFSMAVGDQLTSNPRDKDEFMLIGEHIHSLRISQTQLRDQVQKNSKQLEAFFIRRLLLGEIKPSEIEEKWSQFGYASIACYCVMTIQIDTLEHTRYNELDRDLLMFAINNIAGELISRQKSLEPVVMVNNQVTVCLGNEQERNGFEDQIYRYAEQIQHTVDTLLDLKISVGLSRSYEEVSGTPQAYKESLESLKYRIRFGDQSILRFKDVIPDQQIVSAYPEWMEKELIDAIKMADKFKARHLLNEFIQKTLEDNPRYHEFQMALFRLLIDLLREWQDASETMNLISTSVKPVHEQLFDLKTVEEIEAWFVDTIIEPMILKLAKKWENQYKKISEHMLQMIHEEYETDLSLEVCASRLNYHPNYIKTVFRKETGSNFSDYLSKYRLTVAKRWLVETDMKINEIAEKLMYQNSQNFIRYFRKMEDMTPGQYREKYR